ncbi:Versicolorin B synthase [Lecanosticta acicola]|uniref:Versicolorin B synthase n=1 Tax=Lecanosticta acicola TaxID=111012 RepID=A0AAI8Z3J1_9PEZI|nr:Versicolorin B synthase [Lecanosticta acicola]
MGKGILAYALLALGSEASVISQLSGPGRLTGSNFGIVGKNATYDYVIVGGGLAGSVVASRLTQYSNASVALVEAGNFYELSNGNWSQIPYWSEQWVGAEEDDWQPNIDWGLFTEPQVNGKSIHYAQGKNLGGSSGRNQMMYHRPTKGAYQLWADTVGDQAYTWENMTKYLERSMRFTPDATNRTAYKGDMVYATDAYSPTGGPLHVSYPKYVNPLSRYGQQAFAATGQKQLPGFASGDLDGYGWWQFTIDPTTGLRSSAESSFLEQSFGRRGLTTYVNTMGRNILFQNGTAKAVNVTGLGGERPFTLTATREVIVSAGAWHSPQLLMVSGIGPKATLQNFSIPVVKDAPGVGQNMWDTTNPGGPVYEISVAGYSTWQQEGFMDEAISQLVSNGSGPLTNIGLDIGNWDFLPGANLSNSTREALKFFPSDWPIIENSLSSSGSILTATSGQTQYGAVGCLLIAATSRGNMTIQSASNMDRPIINPNWLMNKEDQEVAVAAYRRAREVWAAIPDGIKVGDEAFPGENVTTDAQLLEAIKKNLTPIHHASSSCAMGKNSDPMAVVDSKARVLGVQKLRVIDSSSFPFTPPGHTQGVTYAHAEKLVDDVLSDYYTSMGMRYNATAGT